MYFFNIIDDKDNHFRYVISDSRIIIISIIVGVIISSIVISYNEC